MLEGLVGLSPESFGVDEDEEETEMSRGNGDTPPRAMVKGGSRAPCHTTRSELIPRLCNAPNALSYSRDRARATRYHPAHGRAVHPATNPCRPAESLLYVPNTWPSIMVVARL